MRNVIEMRAKQTICSECKWLMRGEMETSPRYDVWYNLFCGAIDFKPALDIHSGKWGYRGNLHYGEHLDKGTITDNPNPYCRDVNTGDCPYFSEADE